MRHSVGSRLSDTMARHEDEISRFVYSRYIELQIRAQEEAEAAREPPKAPKFPERRVTQGEMRTAYEDLLGRRLRREEKLPATVREHLGKKPAPSGLRFSITPHGGSVLPEEYLDRMKAFVKELKEQKGPEGGVRLLAEPHLKSMKDELEKERRKRK